MACASLTHDPCGAPMGTPRPCLSADEARLAHLRAAPVALTDGALGPCSAVSVTCHGRPPD